MNIIEVNPADKPVSAKSIFKSEKSSVTAIQILEGELLKEHITKEAALLVCVFGEVLFENEKGESHNLNAGDFITIEAMIKHWVKAIETSRLLLVK